MTRGVRIRLPDSEWDRVARWTAPLTPVMLSEEFATGFKTPVDVTVDRDGTLLVLDYGGGKLYRIVWAG